MESSPSTTETRPYRMVARAAAVDATREAILDAATALFWESPTTEISLVDVADRAGVSRRTVLRHFGTVEGLFAATYEHETRRIDDERGVPDGADPTDAVRVLVDHYERVGVGVLRLLADEERIAGLTEIADRGRTEHRAWCRQAFAEALVDLQGVDHDRRLAQLTAVCDVQMWKLLRHDAGLSRRQTEQALVELLLPLMERRP